jgi:hypothetical protein
MMRFSWRVSANGMGRRSGDQSELSGERQENCDDAEARIDSTPRSILRLGEVRDRVSGVVEAG